MFITQFIRIYCLLLLLTPFPALAQFIIQGQVINEKAQPVKAASVTLLKLEDNRQITSVITNGDGMFRIETSDTSAMVIRAEAEGYLSDTKPFPGKLNSVTIILKKDIKLSEVTIAANKAVVEQKADRTIFNIENSVAADAGDAYAALKKTPGVQIMQGQIMVAGKGGVGVMMNGRLLQLSGEDLSQFLHSIPSTNLSKIEVISSPGAKYDAEGTTGLINIITKKNLTAGLRGTATANLTKNFYYSPSGSLSLQYRNKKLNLYSNNSLGVWNWLYTGKTWVYFPDFKRYQESNIKYSTTNGRIHLGGDYAVNKKLTVGFSYANGIGGSDNNENIQSLLYSNNASADTLIWTKGTTHDVYKDRHTVNLNFEWKIDTTGRKLNVDADYFTQSTDRSRFYVVNDYAGNESLPMNSSENKIKSGTSVTIQSLKADLELPGKFARFTTGAKAAFVSNEGFFQYSTKTGSEFLNDTARGNRFLFDEEIQAAYINGKKAIGKFDIQAGVRIERTFNRGYTPATNQVFTREYTEVFPSFNLLYKINDSHSLGLSYTRRLNRPGYNLLNPFRFYLTHDSYMEGNPDLQPSFNNGGDISWFIKNQYTLRFRVNNVHNYWDRLYFTDSAAGTTSLKRANVGNATYYNLTLNFNRSICKWWDIQGSTGTEYSRFRLNAYNEERFFDGFNGWIEIQNTFYLNKKRTLIAELHSYYYTPRQKDYKRWEEMSVLDGGVKAMFFNKNLVLGFFFEDPFNKAYWDQKNQINGTTEFSFDNAALVNFSVTYKFGNNTLKGRREKSDSVEEIQRARN
jgi:outer membrane receptor protein involved in Fe transport